MYRNIPDGSGVRPLAFALLVAAVCITVTMLCVRGHPPSQPVSRNLASSAQTDTSEKGGWKTQPPVVLSLRCSNPDPKPGDQFVLYVDVTSLCEDMVEIRIKPPDGVELLGAGEWVLAPEREATETLEVPLRVLGTGEQKILVEAVLRTPMPSIEDAIRNDDILMSSHIVLGSSDAEKNPPQTEIKLNSRGERIIVSEGVTTVR